MLLLLSFVCLIAIHDNFRGFCQLCRAALMPMTPLSKISGICLRGRDRLHPDGWPFISRLKIGGLSRFKRTASL